EGTRIQLREIGAAEQRQTRVDDLAALFLTMHECGEFLGDGTLGSSSLRPLLGLPGQLLDLFTRTEAERPEVTDQITIVGIEPELVEGVRRGQFGVQPEVVPGFALTELGAIGLGEQMSGQGVRRAVRFVGVDTPNQVEPCSDVSPLVRAAGLQCATVASVE